jgi:hypothetical protein
MSYGYASEKLYSALHYAIGTTDSPQRRLAGAYSSGVYLLQHEIVPDEEIQQRLRKLNAALTTKKDEGNGSIHASAMAMSNDDATKWLQEMLSLLVEVSQRYALEVKAAAASR